MASGISKHGCCALCHEPGLCLNRASPRLSSLKLTHMASTHSGYHDRLYALTYFSLSQFHETLSGYSEMMFCMCSGTRESARSSAEIGELLGPPVKVFLFGIEAERYAPLGSVTFFLPMSTLRSSETNTLNSISNERDLSRYIKLLRKCHSAHEG